MTGSSKRFGVRYGRRLRLKLEAVETEQKTKYKCPYCYKTAVRRMAVGIWNCPKCSKIFTGRAYSIAQKPIEEEIVETPEVMLNKEKKEKESSEEEEFFEGDQNG